MSSPSPIHRLRIILIAVVNGILTWTILIIAPLGIFAVITCTALVVLSSLISADVVERILLPLFFGKPVDQIATPTLSTPLQPSPQTPTDLAPQQEHPSLDTFRGQQLPPHSQD
jgi:hypothetical protein